MKFDDFGASDSLKRLIESMRTQSHMLDQPKSTQHAIDALNASFGIKEMLDAQNRWKSDLASYVNPALGLREMLERQSSFAQLSASRIDELARTKSFLGAFESSLGNSVRSMMEKIEAGHRSNLEILGHTSSESCKTIEVFARHSEQTHAALERLTESVGHRAAFGGVVSDMIRGRDHAAQIAASLRKSFELSQLVGTASVALALEQSVGAIARQHSEQFARLQDRIKDIVGGRPTFDLATTAFLADFYGAAGIARQLASLGLTPENFLGERGDLPLEREEEATVPVEPGWNARRLDDLRNLVINLIASLIFAIYVAPYLANYDAEAINKRLDGIEELVHRLPELLAPQMEAIVRKELEADPVLFVVGTREGKLRVDPVAGSTVVAVGFPNQVLTLLDERGKWIKVEFYDYRAQDVRQGWILKKYCERQSKRPDDERRSQE